MVTQNNQVKAPRRIAWEQLRKRIFSMIEEEMKKGEDFEGALYNVRDRLSEELGRDVEVKSWYTRFLNGRAIAEIAYIVRVYDAKGRKIQHRYAVHFFPQSNYLSVLHLKV